MIAAFIFTNFQETGSQAFFQSFLNYVSVISFSARFFVVGNYMSKLYCLNYITNCFFHIFFILNKSHEC